MNSELTMIKILEDKSKFYRFFPYVKDYTVSKETYTILKEVDKYFTSNATTTVVDWNTLGTNFIITSKLNREDAEVYKTIFELLCEALSSTVPADDILKHYITLDYATKIMDVAMKVSEGSKSVSLDDVLKNVKEYQAEVGTALKIEEVFAPTDITALVEKVSSGGFEWRLDCLNKSLGTFRAGDFIIMAARPESGKTTMLASELTYFATQMKKEDERPIIWVNNEENSDKVMFRVIQAALGCKSEHILEDTAKAMDEYEKICNGTRNRIMVMEKNSKRNNVSYLSGLFEELKPAVIVFDQLDKVYGFNKEFRDDLRLGKLYEWARELATESAVIAISQVSGSGEGQKWIYQDQLRGSTTDKAGEADAIVTIGRVNDPALINSRFIHVPKNKLLGGGKSEEEFRHGYFEVEIVPSIARYIDGGASA